jgi:PKHD-type hydroxylase
MEGFFLLRDVLTNETRNRILSTVRKAVFVDGKQTAGGMARAVKNNEQIELARIPELADEIIALLRKNREFQYLTMPSRLSTLLISRYQPGMAYGTHTDNAIMPGGGRSDISFTLMLSDEGSYQGGELSMETSFGDQTLKIPGGSLVLYPTGGLHRVVEVEDGERIAIVGWIQSRVRDAAKRQVLYDLDKALKDHLNHVGHDRTADLLFKSTANLRRMWDEG